MRLLVEDDKEMGEQQPRQSKEQNGGRLLVRAEAYEHKKTADIHGIAHEPIRSNDHELARRVHGAGVPSPRMTNVAMQANARIPPTAITAIPKAGVQPEKGKPRVES